MSADPPRRQHPSAQKLVSHASKGKRSFHHKGKTGCRICRARRVRCDEQRPACNRCTITGRKCEGYATDPLYLASFTLLKQSSASTAQLREPTGAKIALDSGNGSRPSVCNVNVLADQRLFFMQGDPEQIRSFRYFLHVAAPAIAGSFNAGFWTQEVPRACHSDPSLWHAIVSLGSVYEDHVAFSIAGKTNQSYRNVFALEHFNKAVRHLVDPKSTSALDKWRAVILSNIFTTICLVEGLYNQAVVHFQSGCALLGELKTLQIQQPDSTPALPLVGCERQATSLAAQRISSLPSPISYSSMREVLASIEIWIHALGCIDSRDKAASRLRRDEGPNHMWKHYVAPCPSTGGELLNEDNLIAANRAAECLLTDVLSFNRQHAGDFERLYAEGGIEIVRMLLSEQEQLARAFRQVHRALISFEKELHAGPSGYRSPPRMSQLRLGTYHLALYVAAIRLFIIRPFRNYPTDDRMNDAQTTCTTVLQMAQQIVNLETDLGSSLKPAHLGPLPPITTPLSLVTVISPVIQTRMEAMNILKQPRVEGYLDGLRMVVVAQAVMAAETASDKCYRQPGATDSIDPEALKRFGTASSGNLHPLSRMYTSGIMSFKRGEATVYIQTWGERLSGTEGQNMVVTW